MIAKANITEDDLAFFVGLQLIKLNEDEIIFPSSCTTKRKRNYKELIIQSRNDEFIAKVSQMNMNVDIFINATIERGKSALFSSDFFKLAVHPTSTQINRMTALLEDLKHQHFYHDQIVATHFKNKVDPQFSNCELSLQLNQVLKSQEISKLYTHQVEAILNIRKHKNVIVSTTTASGKSLIFQIPTIEQLVQDPSSTFLYMFPTKALSNDQLINIRKILNDLSMSVLANTYDGDTMKSERVRIRESSQILFTNPDMMHCAILPNHHKWEMFFKNLKYVIIDECHVYKGVFGNHISMILKRLQRICAFYNNFDLLFLGFSATIGNPLEHFTALISNQEAIGISNDTSPSYPRHSLVWDCITGNPEIAELAIFFVRNRIKMLIFTLYRQQTEQLLHEIHKLLQEQGFMRYKSFFKSYRGGYQAELRRQIEKEFKYGELYCVVSTNALELGVDIGSIDVVLHIGFPGTDSYIQQLGRSGRRFDAISIMMGNSNNMVDKYWLSNPQELFNLTPSPVTITNLALLQYKHAASASAEIPLNKQELNDFISVIVPEFANYLVYDDHHYYYDRTRFPNGPHNTINIRGDLHHYFKILLKYSNELLEEIEEYRAFFTLYPGCIFMHCGKTYLIDDVIFEDRTAWVYPSNVDYFTKVDDVVDVDPKTTIKIFDRVQVGTVTSKSTIYGYSKFNLSTNALISKHTRDPLTLKRTIKGCWLTIEKHIEQIMNFENSQNIYYAIHTVNHVLMSLLPSIVEENSEIQCECRGENVIRQRPAQLMFYERKVTGYCEILGKNLVLLFRKVNSTFNCDCEKGCYRCIYISQCRTRNVSLDKRLGKQLTELLIKEYL